MNFTVYYRVSTQGRIRYETVFLGDAQAFAKDLYKKEGVIAEIDEFQRDAK